MSPSSSTPAGPRWPLLLGLTAGLCLVAWYTTPVREQVAVLRQSWQAAHDYPERAMAMLLRAGTGEFVLPPPVLAAVRLQRRYHLTRYDLSPGLRREDLLYQRLVEGSWPHRCAAGAPALFMTAAEAATELPPTAARVEADGIVLVWCH